MSITHGDDQLSLTTVSAPKQGQIIGHCEKKMMLYNV